MFLKIFSTFMILLLFFADFKKIKNKIEIYYKKNK